MKILSIILLLVPSVNSLCNAQNLIPNGSFESYSSPPSSYGQTNLAIPWDNCQWGNPSGSASPDYYVVGQFMANYFGVIDPPDGAAQMGLYTFRNQGEDAREYICVQLNSSLVIGQEYTLSFYITTGVDGNYTARTNNVQAYFSENPISQISTNVITVPAQVEIPGVVDHEGYWEFYSFNFIADNTSNYMAIGNFETDANTVVVGGTKSYYFFDDFTLVPSSESILISGNTEICLGESTTLLAYNDSVYSWAEIENPNDILSTDSAILVNPTVTTTYMVYGSNDTATSTVTVLPAPSISLGNDTTLCNGSLLTLSYFNAVGTTQWSTGANSASIQVFEDGDYWVSATNSCGTVYDSISVEFVNSALVDLGNDTTICEGDSISLSVPSSFDSYLWSNGDTTSATLILSAGDYWFEGTEGTCATASDTISVDVFGIGVSIVVNGSTLSVPGTYLSYQWFFNGSPIPNATDPTYEALLSGNYSVQVRSSNNCVAMSYVLEYTNPNTVNDNDFELNFSIYPNPGAENVVIESELTDPYSIHVFNAQGQLIFHSEQLLGRQLTPLLNLASGVYLVKLETVSGRYTKRLIITN